MTDQVSTLTITQPDPLTKNGNLEENWNKWKQNFQIYLVASGISETDNRASALFLHTIGQYGCDIANELELMDIENITVQQLYEKFDKYCEPNCKLAFVRYQFFNTKQSKQPFDAFFLSLKQKSKNCKFGDLADSLIMTQIVAGISNKKLQERLFLIDDLDLDKTVQECRAAELAESHVQFIPITTERVTRKRPEKRSSKVKEKPARNKGEQKQQPMPRKTLEFLETQNVELMKELHLDKTGQESQVQPLPSGAIPRKEPARNQKFKPKKNAYQGRPNKYANDSNKFVHVSNKYAYDSNKYAYDSNKHADDSNETCVLS